MQERILAAAIKLNGQTFSFLPPARHGEIYRFLSVLYPYGLPDECNLEQQGFVTSNNRFVDRFEGCKIAESSGQIVNQKTFPLDELFSEDMW